MGKAIRSKNLLVELGLMYEPGHMKTVTQSVKPEKYLFKKILSKANEYGRAAVAQERIEAGDLVLRFRGEIKTFDEYPFAEKPYLIPVGNFLWINPVGTPRYINHSCEPNCEIRNKIELYAIRSIEPGEEISFSYNVITEDSTSSSASFFEECRWDHAFTFLCLCGSRSCVGVVDKNITFKRVGEKPAEKPRKKKAMDVA